MKYNQGMTKILLSGVPGTGKSTVAHHLETNHGFYHVDMEKDDFAPRHELSTDREGFLNKLVPHDNIVISWGFGPFPDKDNVKYLKDHGYIMVWLDGDRVASFREFMKRENNNPVKEADYYGQMLMVVVTDIVKTLNPIIVNPFSEASEFRAVQDITDEVIRRTSAE